MKMPSINVWSSPKQSEMAIDRVSKCAVEVSDACGRLLVLAKRLQREAAESPMAANQLKSLSEELYSMLSEHLQDEEYRR
jgi:hypothetical protein